MALAMLLAQGAEGLSGGAGWVGAGLLGAVLAWVFMKHLPAKDTQLEKLISDKDIMIKELVAGHAKSIREVVGHCEEDAEKTRAVGERWHSETMAALHRLHESTREGVHVTRNVGNQIVLRQRVADAFQSLELPAWTKALDGTLMSWNAAAERLLGWKQGEVVGKSVYASVIPESHKREEADVLLRIGAGESLEEYETLRVARDGRLVPLRVVTSPVRDQSGRVVGASTVAHSLDAG